MVTISQVVKRIIRNSPVLQDSMIEDIVSYANLAEYLKPRIEAELGEEVKAAAVMMALRRHSHGMRRKADVRDSFRFSSEIIMKNNLCDICIVKTPSALDKIKQLYRAVDYDKGETLNVIQGNYEITIVVSQKHLPRLKHILKGEKILNVEKNLVSLTLTLSREFLYTPGLLSLPTRKLAWENINIFENISTMTELIFIIAEKDAVRAYNVFREITKPG